MDIVPYIVLLVVPVLGRMSDPSDTIRFMATQCFATLIRLLPLEVNAHNLNTFLSVYDSSVANCMATVIGVFIY